MPKLRQNTLYCCDDLDDTANLTAGLNMFIVLEERYKANIFINTQPHFVHVSSQ